MMTDNMTDKEREPYRIMAKVVKEQIKSILDKGDDFHFVDLSEVRSRVQLLEHFLPYTLKPYSVSDGLSTTE